MTRLLSKISIGLQAALIISSCFQQCASLNIKRNHRANPPSIGRSVPQKPQISTLSSSQELRVQTLNFGYENDPQEMGLQPFAVGVTGNSTEPGHTLSSIVAPSTSTTATAHTNMSIVEKIQLGTALGCAISAFLAIVLKSSPGSWRFFLAGGLCAAISHTIPTPVDVVKVRDKRLYSSSLPKIDLLTNDRLNFFVFSTLNLDSQTGGSGFDR